MTAVTQQLSTWRGSENTKEVVRDAIEERWGSEEAEKYDPLKNCFTFATWKKKGYIVKKGEKGIRSITSVKAKNSNKEENEAETRKYWKPVYLFYIKQVEKM